MESLTPERIIATLGMQPHPEGGHYVETFRDAPPGGGRGVKTGIHYLLQAGERSHWHRVDAVVSSDQPFGLRLYTIRANWRHGSCRVLGRSDLEQKENILVL
ncbi:hypothetical protein CHT98_20515 (plasmid) [Azospirillum brasilense]|uniref:DUF985 domain-containing protein n=1 Tax=Azospirillum brasilense TaxID=192 RepID=A0A235HA01_AZOBR|nr:hypothetical protein CHT98_20515 [Azospirillum brasilense]